MTSTRTFMTGRSQAVRIPLEFRLPDEEILVNKVGDTITLTPKSKLENSFILALDSFTDDYMAEGKPTQTVMEPEADL